jgi:hypothetical protein
VVGCVTVIRSTDSHASPCPGETVTSAGSVTGTHHGNHGQMDHLRHRSSRHPRVITDTSCNTVELVEPNRSRYIPDVASATVHDREQAQALLDGVNAFCRTHSTAELKAAHWWGGTVNPSQPTHVFNPDPTSRGLDPANPRAALIYHGQLGGVMFTGEPLPPLGSIPRAHIHDISMPVEMVHVYCTPNLRDAFTPSRTLGVLADLSALRQRIRPAVAGLQPPQLAVVRSAARAYAGGRLPVVAPAAALPNGPDPVLQARRTQIRLSLMELSEAQLRSLWSLMRSP